MIEARFVGGSLDGQTKRMAGARRFVVPVRVDEPSHADDVNWVELDDDGLPKPRNLKVKTETYLRSEFRHADGRLEFVYELESSE